MTRVGDLLAELRATLGAHTVSYSSASAANDVYEGFVFSLVVATAAEAGAVVHYEDVRKRATGDLVFRTSPGRLHSTTRPYTHAVVQFAGTPALEVHVGVFVQGNSRVSHECDVLVLHGDEADECRRTGMLPRTRKCVLAIECKHYVGHLPLGQARGFVGLADDLGKTASVFVTNTSSDSVVRYLSHRGEGWEHHVVPTAPQLDHLRSTIRMAFRNHVSKHNPRLRI